MIYDCNAIPERTKEKKKTLLRTLDLSINADVNNPEIKQWSARQCRPINEVNVLVSGCEPVSSLREHRSYNNTKT